MRLESSGTATGQRARQRTFALPFRLFFIVALLLSTFGGAFGALTPGASAATTTFNVDSTADTPVVGACALALPNSCTLRGAIIETNALAATTPAATFVINLTSGATYTLSTAGPNEDNAATGDLDIKANVTINGKGTGTGPGAIIVGNDPANADNSQQDRVFQVFGGYTVVFNDLTIEDGYAYQASGGGILHDGCGEIGGSLTLNGVTVTDNDTGFTQPNDSPGAGLYNGTNCALTLNNSTISDNGLTTVTNPGDGGGIYNVGTLTVQNNSVISGNLGGDGGGIYNSGTATISNSAIRSNTAGKTAGFFIFQQPLGNGGGIYNAAGATLSLTDTTITANGAAVGGGLANLSNGEAIPTTRGARAAAIAVMVNGGTIANNTALICGGGIANGVDFFLSSGQADSSLTVTGTTIQNNAATGGTIIVPSEGFFQVAFGGLGGGLCNNGPATISQATIATNSAAAIGTQNERETGLGGGMSNTGILMIDRSTLAGNSVSGPGYGGAIANGTITRQQAITQVARPSGGARIASRVSSQ